MLQSSHVILTSKRPAGSVGEASDFGSGRGLWVPRWTPLAPLTPARSRSNTSINLAQAARWTKMRPASCVGDLSSLRRGRGRRGARSAAGQTDSTPGREAPKCSRGGAGCAEQRVLPGPGVCGDPGSREPRLSKGPAACVGRTSRTQRPSAAETPCWMRGPREAKACSAERTARSGGSASELAGRGAGPGAAAEAGVPGRRLEGCEAR